MRRALPLLAVCGALLGCPAAPGPPTSPPGRDAGPCALRTEICNGEDDDCNGSVDDTGLLEACDGVDQDCDGSFDEGTACHWLVAPGPTGWQLGPGSTGVLVVDDALTLAPRSLALAQASIWIANAEDGTVSRIDPDSGREVARYPSVGAGSGLTPGREHSPSRTALDQRLDAYVANRAFGGQATVTKIASDPSRCVDRDLDGVIDTSDNWDGSLSIELEPAEREYVGVDDECVLWTVPVGGLDALARGLAIGLAGADGEPGDVWVGLFNEERAVVLSQHDGHEIASVPLELTPYGAATGADGQVWFSSGLSGRRYIAGVDPATLAVTRVELPLSELETYGIAVDGLGRVILAAQRELDRRVVAYDPRGRRWTVGPNLGAGGLLRGLGASADRVWVATAGGALELAVSDLSLVRMHPFGTDLVGVGVAFDGAVWGVPRSSVALRLDPTTGAIRSTPVGQGPYTYSDFTGFGLNGILDLVGNHQVVVEGCDAAEWTALRVDADVPPGTRVAVRVRTSSEQRLLPLAPWVVGAFEVSASLVAPPGPVPPGRYLEVGLRLSSSTPGVVPRVHTVHVAARCTEPD